jgi:thiol-disulfide isomerase/thioredoxin
MGMLTGLIILVVVLAAASVTGFVFRSRQGRFRHTPPAKAPLASTGSETALAGTDRAGTAGGIISAGSVLTAADLGAPLGERATLVQFSTEYCTYCGPTRDLLTEVAAEQDGVAFVEIDAAERMDLTRRLRVMATPTVLLLGPGGAIESRASGRPRKPELRAAVGVLLGTYTGS